MQVEELRGWDGWEGRRLQERLKTQHCQCPGVEAAEIFESENVASNLGSAHV